jgi:hypothetical protein
MAFETFRIFKRSENRQGFGHREYHMMSRKGIYFIAQRVYDLPVNGEIEVAVKKTENDIHWPSCGEAWDFGALRFECQRRIFPNAPKNVIEEVFKAPTVPTDIHGYDMA